MKKVIDFVLLKKEAYLFDAKLYIVKAFIAVLTAYAIVHQLPLVHKDMISVLFGLMMTLEPVTITGIRSGLRQITATILGALATVIIITFWGINLWTVALSVSATLFLCLKINWREVSPVAIFTSIYMTQYVQYTAKNEPSMILTFQLRILALGIGILTAILINFLFSLFFYKRMEIKRITHILVKISEHMKQVKKGLEESRIEIIYQEKEALPSTFVGIDWLASLIKDKEKEAKLLKRLRLFVRDEKIVAFQNILLALRNITHLVYDITYDMSYHLEDYNNSERLEIVNRLNALMKECVYLAVYSEKDFIKYVDQDQKDQSITMKDNRVMNDLKDIQEMLDIINENLFNL